MRRAVDLARGLALPDSSARTRIEIVHCHKGKARTLALLAGLLVRIPVLVLNRGVSFSLDRWNRLGYTTPRVTAIVAVCESIKRGLVGRRRARGQDRGDLLGHRSRPASIRAWTARPSGASSGSRPISRSSPRSASARGAATTTCSTPWSACTAPAPRARLLFVGAPPPRIAQHRRQGARAGARRARASCSATATTCPEILAASDLVVDASYAGLGLTGSIREALAVETPVIGHRPRGHARADRRRRDRACSCRRANPEAMAQAMLRMLDDPARAKAMARAGRKRVEARFSLARQARRDRGALPPAAGRAARAAEHAPRSPSTAGSSPYLRPYWPCSCSAPRSRSWWRPRRAPSRGW